MFKDHLQLGEAINIKRDPSKSKALRKMAVARIKVAEQVALTGEVAPVIFDNIYEGVKSLLLAEMADRGFSPKNHKVLIAFSRDVLKLPREMVEKLDAMRVLRNDIVYRGKAVADIKFVKGQIHFFKQVMAKLLELGAA